MSNCFRYLNINDIDKINRLTIAEYQMLMNGAVLKSIDKQEELFLLAWAIRQAKAKRKVAGISIVLLNNSLIERK